jgi:DNA polymerase epsilon subunit 1
MEHRFYIETSQSATQLGSMLATLSARISVVQVERHLPRVSENSRTASVPLHVLEVSMPETEWITHNKYLTALFSHPDVYGVFESKLPGEFRALLSLGHVCKLKAALSDLPPNNCFDLHDIERDDQRAAAVNYLDMSLLKHMFLYQAHNTGGRGIIGLVLPNQMRAIAIVFSPGSVDRARAVRPMTQKLADYAREFHSTNSHMAALEILQQILQDYRRQRRGPTVIVAQCWGMQWVDGMCG